MSTRWSADRRLGVAGLVCLLAACGATDTELPGETAPDAGTDAVSDVSEAETEPDSAHPDASDAAIDDVAPMDDSGAPDDTATPDSDAAEPDSTDVVACPAVSIRCTVRGLGVDPVSGRLEANAFDIVDCEAESAAPLPDDATIVWSLTERPEASVTALDAANGAATALFLDTHGAYRIEAEVTRTTTCGRVQPATMELVTSVPPGIVATLVWTLETEPGDDDASDLDIHLLHPSGCWEDEVWDVHFRNHHPNWGDPTRTDDNPSMDIDAQGEGNVEGVTYLRPESGQNYRIGVHYWNDHANGPADAKLALFVAGTLVPVPSRRLEHGQFWEVALVSWPSAEVTLLDRVYNTIDEAPCATSP